MIRSFITSLAFGALSVAPAHALQQITTTQAIDVGVPAPLARAVESAGVPVFDGAGSPICEAKDGYVPYAFYNYKHNAILICTNNGTTAEKFVQSYTHEAVHLVQDCRTGIDDLTLYVGNTSYIAGLARNLSPDLISNILDVYEEEDYAAEIEAFFFQDRPLEVARVISSVCDFAST